MSGDEMAAAVAMALSERDKAQAQRNRLEVLASVVVARWRNEHLGASEFPDVDEAIDDLEKALDDLSGTGPTVGELWAAVKAMPEDEP